MLTNPSTVVFAGLLVTAAVGVAVIRTDARRFDHRACAAMAAIAGVQATLALLVASVSAGDDAIALARADAFLWAMGGLASVAFVLAFPLGHAPAHWLRRTYVSVAIGALPMALLLPPNALGPAVGSLAVAVGIAAISGGVLQVRRLTHARGASARLIAAAGILGTWAFIGAAATLADAVTQVAPTTTPSLASRAAPLIAATVAGLATAHYSLVGKRRMLIGVIGWLIGGTLLAVAIAGGHRLLRAMQGEPDPGSAEAALGIAALIISILAVVRGIGRGPDPSDTRVPAGMLPGLPAGPRETLVALDRLTDPLAVQERVVEALTELLPGAKLELLRAPISPPGILVGARTVATPLVLAAVQRGYLLRHQIDELSQDSRDAFGRLGGTLVVPVCCTPAVFGVLLLDNLEVDRSVIVHARRFADLLGYKLETHRLYAELETHRRLASLGTLATALAHDLRTPLAAIRMNIQMLETRADVLGDDVECLEIALSEVDRLNAQISTLLDFARPMGLDVGELDIGALVTEAVTRVAVIATEAKVTLRMDVAPELPRLPGDGIRFSRVLVNLVENAVLASPAGAEVLVQAFSTSEVVDVVVRDRGLGIAEEDLSRIFDPFFTTRADGTGLGLAICRKIVAAHGGRILVSSELGAGSEFRVRLPLRRATPSDE
jgi:signal transduction histidine kinase